MRVFTEFKRSLNVLVAEHRVDFLSELTHKFLKVIALAQRPPFLREDFRRNPRALIGRDADPFPVAMPFVMEPGVLAHRRGQGRDLPAADGQHGADCDEQGIGNAGGFGLPGLRNIEERLAIEACIDAGAAVESVNPIGTVKPVLARAAAYAVITTAAGEGIVAAAAV